MSYSVLRVTLKPKRVQPFYHRHPWVFEGAVARVEGPAEVGAEAVLLTERGEPVARGLWNPHSKIKLRLYGWETDRPLDDGFFLEQLDAAVALRRQLFPQADVATAYRLVCSEGDGLSGLTVDRYGDWLVVQLTSAALATRWPVLQRYLQETLAPRGILLRTEKGIGEAERLDLNDGLLWGEEPPRPLVIAETLPAQGGEARRLEYEVDLQAGQKTGFFLDQRENRVAAAKYLHGDVLDLFCYSGGFDLTALASGTTNRVTGVDVSGGAIELASANAARNGLSDRVTFRQGAAFDLLEGFTAEGRRFDGIIIDPPKMTRSRHTLDKAMKGYFALNKLAVDLLPPGGILVTCSCSGLVNRDDFTGLLATVAMRTGRAIQILEARGPAADHPVSVSCPESDYLKCFICRVG